MAESKKRTVRKGRIYHIRSSADVEYRAFIWEDSTWFCGRVEGYPQIAPCRGRTVVAVCKLLHAALDTTLAS